MLAGVRVTADKGLALPLADGLGDLRGAGGFSRPGTITGGNQYAVGIDKLQFHGAAQFKGLGITDAGLVIIFIVLADVAGKELAGLGCAAHHIRAHIGVVIYGKGTGNANNTDNAENTEQIPINGKLVDCSSFVSWVLYEYGYKEFAGKQHRTKNFMQTNWNEKYGWEEIYNSLFTSDKIM